MNDEHDPLDDLRSAWKGLDPEEHGGDLLRESGETRRAVGWMQKAWAALEIPETVVPFGLGRRNRRRPLRILRYAAAAAVLFAVIMVIPWTSEADDKRPLPQEPGEQNTAPRVLVATEERIEMESGPVHLIMVPGTVTQSE